MIELRDYQDELVTAIRQSYRIGKKAPLVVLPTGGGKTTIFSYIANSAASKEKIVWIVAHRARLVRQISLTLAKIGCMHGIIAPEINIRQIKIAQFKQLSSCYVDSRALVQVCSVQTLAKRLDKIVNKPDILVVDESHHLTTESTWGKVATANPQALLLPVTASPIRLDGKGLGVGQGGFADDIIIGATMGELIDAGYLCDYKIYAPPTDFDLNGVKKRAGDFAVDQVAKKLDKPKITGDCVENWLQKVKGKKTLVFCCGVDHAEHVAAEFMAAGIAAEAISGRDDQSTQEAKLERLENGETIVLTSADLLGEGVDITCIEVVILLRPTASLSLCMQQIGRVMRLHDGKEWAWIFDHVGNILRHGLPDTIHEWTLEGVKKRPRNTDGNAAGIRSCPMCFAIHRPAPVCPQCGHEYTAKERAEMEIQEGELVEVTREQRELMKRRAHVTRKKEEWDCHTVEELAELGRSRGYKFADSWAAKLFATRGKKNDQSA